MAAVDADVALAIAAREGDVEEDTLVVAIATFVAAALAPWL